MVARRDRGMRGRSERPRPGYPRPQRTTHGGGVAGRCACWSRGWGARSARGPRSCSRPTSASREVAGFDFVPPRRRLRDSTLQAHRPARPRPPRVVRHRVRARRGGALRHLRARFAALGPRGGTRHRGVHGARARRRGARRPAGAHRAPQRRRGVRAWAGPAARPRRVGADRADDVVRAHAPRGRVGGGGPRRVATT